MLSLFHHTPIFVIPSSVMEHHQKNPWWVSAREKTGHSSVCDGLTCVKTFQSGLFGERFNPLDPWIPPDIQESLDAEGLLVPLVLRKLLQSVAVDGLTPTRTSRFTANPIYLSVTDQTSHILLGQVLWKDQKGFVSWSPRIAFIRYFYTSNLIYTMLITDACKVGSVLLVACTNTLSSNTSQLKPFCFSTGRQIINSGSDQNSIWEKQRCNN